MNEFYRNIFNEYKNEKFPLRLLGRGGWQIFQTVEELKEYYELLSEVENEEKQKVRR